MQRQIAQKRRFFLSDQESAFRTPVVTKEKFSGSRQGTGKRNAIRSLPNCFESAEGSEILTQHPSREVYILVTGVVVVMGDSKCYWSHTVRKYNKRNGVESREREREEFRHPG